MTHDNGTTQRHRDLWSLGLRFSALMRRGAGPRFKPSPAALAAVQSALEPLGVRLNVAELAKEERREGIRVDITSGAARIHGTDVAALFSLGWAAGDLVPFADVSLHDDVPPPTEQTIAAARRFLEESAPLTEPVRSELAEIRGWCEAVVRGWATSCDVRELGLQINEAFGEGCAEEAPDPDVDLPSTVHTATPEHVVQMIAMHHIVCSICAMRMRPSSMLRGSITEGIHAYNDQSESHFVIGWCPQGIVGFAFHKYAGHDEIDVPEEERDPMRLVPGLPEALQRLAIQLSNSAGRWFTSGFYVTPGARRLEPGFEDDGSDHFKVLCEPARDALFKRRGDWARIRSITAEQGELGVPSPNAQCPAAATLRRRRPPSCSRRRRRWSAIPSSPSKRRM